MGSCLLWGVVYCGKLFTVGSCLFIVGRCLLWEVVYCGKVFTVGSCLL